MKVSTLTRKKGSKSLKGCNTFGNNVLSLIYVSTLTHNIGVTRRVARVTTKVARVCSSTGESDVAVHRSERLDVRLEGQAAGGAAGSSSGGEQGVVVTLS